MIETMYCAIANFIIYVTGVSFGLFIVAPLSFAGIAVIMGIIGAVIYGGRKDDNIQPKENTREW